MPIRSSKFYNDPSIGAAFENLAAAFAPPSGADAAGWARANAEREAAGRLTWLFNNPNDPTSSNRSALIGVQDYSQTPGGFAATDATNRRGQDVTAQTTLATNELDNATARYGYDLNAQTSRANNDSDNARALDDRRIQEAGALQRFYAQPVKVGQGERAYLPGGTATATGLPAQLDGSAAPLTESQELARIISEMPIGEQQGFVRDKFAPTETQVQGQERRDLRERGRLTDDDLVNDVLSAMPVESVVGPDGKTPEIVTRRDALGRQPYNAPGATAKPDLENWIGPNGRGGGTAIFDPTAGQWLDTSTRQPLPAGSRTYTGQLQGGAEATGLGPTPSNATEATRLESSLDAAESLVGNIRGILARNPNVAGIPGRVKGVVQSLTSSAQQVAGAYAKDAPEAALSIDEARQMLDNVLGDAAKGYDPNVVRIQSAVFDLAYMRAQINNPGGEVSRQAFERALESLGQTFLSSQTDLETALSAFEQDTIAVNRVKVSSLRGQRPNSPGAAPAASPSNAAPAQGAAPARRRYNPETGVFE